MHSMFWTIYESLQIQSNVIFILVSFRPHVSAYIAIKSLNKNKIIYTQFINKEFLCITHTVENKYISPSSTVGIELGVSALYVASHF